MLAGANVSCILDVKIFSSNSKKYGYNKKNALVFAFKKKFRVVDDFMREFLCRRYLHKSEKGCIDKVHGFQIFDYQSIKFRDHSNCVAGIGKRKYALWSPQCVTQVVRQMDV